MKKVRVIKEGCHNCVHYTVGEIFLVKETNINSMHEVISVTVFKDRTFTLYINQVPKSECEFIEEFKTEELCYTLF